MLLKKHFKIMEELTDWFSTLDPEARSEIIGQLLGSMIGEEGGMIDFAFLMEGDEDGAERRARVVIRRGESGEGEDE